MYVDFIYLLIYCNFSRTMGIARLHKPTNISRLTIDVEGNKYTYIS